MGCFNKTAFFSHLPITYGDEIVMFLCADTSYSRCLRDECPIDINGNGIMPIAPPFFGTYNDYGGIEHVVEDANYKLFKDKFGMSLEEFCNLECSCITIGKAKQFIEDIKSGKKKTNEWHHETIEDYERLLALLRKIFGNPPVIRKYCGNDKNVKKAHEDLYTYELNKYNNTSLLLTMEHKAVYDKMVELGKQNYFNYWIGEKSLTVEESFDATSNFFNKLLSISDEFCDNPFILGGCKTIDKIDELRENESINKESLIAVCKELLSSSHNFIYGKIQGLNLDIPLYNDLKGDITPYKDNICDFIYFLSSMGRTNTTFEVSPYHSQTVCYETIIPIFEEFLEILKRKSALES